MPPRLKQVAPYLFVQKWLNIFHFQSYLPHYNTILDQTESHFQCCGSGMFISHPGSEFFYLGSMVEKIPDPRSGSAIKSISESFNKLSEIWCEIFSFHPGSRFLPSRIQGVKTGPDLGSGSATRVISRLENSTVISKMFILIPGASDLSRRLPWHQEDAGAPRQSWLHQVPRSRYHSRASP